MTAASDQAATQTPARKQGDLVHLISGGPHMVIEYLRQDGFAGCVWFVEAEANRDEFPTSALVLAPSLRVVARAGGAAS